jgi:hypothetical protein
MNLNYVRTKVAVAAFLSLALSACASSESEPRPIIEIDLTDSSVPMGCVQPSFPDVQPDLSRSVPPFFPSDAPNGQALVDPGDEIAALIEVNGATRFARVELRDAWSTESMIAMTEVDTPGNQSIPLVFAPDSQVIGRFYMRITLCGLDCRDRSVVFDINPDYNSDYERTLIEDGEVVQVDRTCIDLGETPTRGSGTVVIQ